MKTITKTQIINEVIERTDSYDGDCGYIIQTREGDILDNTECTRKQLREAVAIEDWNWEEDITWGVFTK